MYPRRPKLGPEVLVEKAAPEIEGISGRLQLIKGKQSHKNVRLKASSNEELDLTSS
jgi:hypothetical protein